MLFRPKRETKSGRICGWWNFRRDVRMTMYRRRGKKCETGVNRSVVSAGDEVGKDGN